MTVDFAAVRSVVQGAALMLPLLLSLPVPIARAERPWNEPVIGYRQEACLAEESSASAMVAWIQARGLDSRMLFKEGADCWAVLLAKDRDPYRIYQIGAFANPAGARLVAESVTACGFETKIIEIAQPGRLLHHVRGWIPTTIQDLEQFDRCLYTNPFIPEAPILIVK